MFEQAFKNIDDVLWKEAGCTTELDYTEQSSWLLFLKYLDGLEQDKATEAELEGKKYSYILDKPYRWGSWAAPKEKDGEIDHNRAMTGDDLRQRRGVLHTAPAHSRDGTGRAAEGWRAHL
jgi:type I restriction enzyme M protein